MILNIEVPNMDYEVMPEILAYKLYEENATEQARFFDEFINDISSEDRASLAAALSRNFYSGKAAREFFEDLANRIRAEMIIAYGGDFD